MKQTSYDVTQVPQQAPSPQKVGQYPALEPQAAQHSWQVLVKATNSKECNMKPQLLQKLEDCQLLEFVDNDNDTQEVSNLAFL